MDYQLYNLAEIKAEFDDTSLLDTHEREQYARRGEAYLLTRVLLKKELARRCGLEPTTISFTYNEHGKPSLEHQYFNISHSAHLLCMAFHHHEIGVDIQQIRPLRKIHTLAERIMSPLQYEHFLASGAQPEDFFTCWSISEALVKLHGTSIWDAHQYPYLYANGRVTMEGALPHIKLHLFTPAPGFCGAIAFVE